MKYLISLCFVSSLALATGPVQSSAIETCHQALISEDDSVTAIPVCKVQADKGEKLGHFYYAMAILLEQLPFKTAMHTGKAWHGPSVVLTVEDIKWIKVVEKQLQLAGDKGHNEAYYQLGQLIIHTKNVSALNKGSVKKRHKKGLFYFVNAADSGNKKAITALSDYVNSKMEDGKIPLRFSHYLSYVEMDWQQQGKKTTHHYAAYETWLAQVEQSQLEPEKLGRTTLFEMAKDYENGYFLYKNPDMALKLYQMAADRGDTLAQYKAGDLLYPSKPAEAVSYLHQAAANQSADAMLRLGDHFGCQGKKKQALHWYDQALAKGSDYAADEKTALLKTGKPSQCN
jgi:TPR repeat protein